MSLLMQALRKAESAKKSQAAADAGVPPAEAAVPATEAAVRAPPTAELTLQSMAPSRDEIAAAEAASAQADASALSDPPETVRVIEPSAPPAPAPVAEPVDYFGSDLPVPRPSYVAPEAPAPIAAPAQEPVNRMPDSARDDPAVSGAASGERLKINLEQQAASESAARKTAEARSAAGAVFAAKQRAGNRRPLLIAGVGLLVLGMAGAYLYFQFVRIAQPPLTSIVPNNPVAVVVPVPATAVPVDPAAPPVVAPIAVSQVPVATVAPAAPVVAAPVAAPAARAAASEPVFPSASRPAPARPRAAAPSAPSASSAPSAPSAPRPSPSAARDTAPIEFRRNDGSRQVNPTLSGAYQAFVAGDTASARSQYQRVLQQEPDNRDALLGMAAIAVNRGQAAEAGSFYGRLLELDPSDAEAGAGMASVQRADVGQTESRLKKVLDASPQNGSALFALGNVYAQQARWPEAQQAYFGAVGSAPANADYAFNLAVSLDKLNQKKLALENYQRALQLAQHGAANVNQAVVRDRIKQLQQELAAR